MIDFTNCKELFNNYSGSEKKKTLFYNNKGSCINLMGL